MSIMKIMKARHRMNELIEMIIVYAEHIYDETHAKGYKPLNEKDAVDNDCYFEDLIGYGENFVEYCKAARALARAKQLKQEEVSQDNVEGKFDYAVVVYGGFDQVPLIAYQRNYDDKDQAVEVYHELEDTFRLEHKIFDNNNEVFIPQSDCSSMAIIRSGAFDDDRVVYFKSLVDNTNYEDYTEDFNLIVKYFQEHNMMS